MECVKVSASGMHISSQTRCLKNMGSDFSSEMEGHGFGPQDPTRIVISDSKHTFTIVTCTTCMPTIRKCMEEVRFRGFALEATCGVEVWVKTLKRWVPWHPTHKCHTYTYRRVIAAHITFYSGAATAHVPIHIRKPQRVWRNRGTRWKRQELGIRAGRRRQHQTCVAWKKKMSALTRPRT